MDVQRNVLADRARLGQHGDLARRIIDQGGIIMGVGMALLEEGQVDQRNGRVINNNMGDYLLPTNADIPDIEVISVGVPDYDSSVLGGKGVGELGIVGVAAAIANAVYHATGVRVRNLPITMDKLVGSLGD